MNIKIDFGHEGSVLLPIAERRQGRSVEFVSDVGAQRLEMCISEKAREEIGARWSALLSARGRNRGLLGCQAGRILYVRVPIEAREEMRETLRDVLSRPGSLEAFTDEAIPRRIESAG